MSARTEAREKARRIAAKVSPAARRVEVENAAFKVIFPLLQREVSYTTACEDAQGRLDMAHSQLALMTGRYEGALATAKLFGLAGAATQPTITPEPVEMPLCPREDCEERGKLGATFAPYCSPECRDLDETHRLHGILSLVVHGEDFDQITAEKLDDLTVAERRKLVEWAGATHLSASDNDDVEVPDRPTAILKKLGCDEGWHEKLEQERCPKCKGRGELIANASAQVAATVGCPLCNGTGKRPTVAAPG